MNERMETAKDVSEFLIEATGRALVTDNYDLFSSCVALPFDIETFEGRRSLEAPEDVRKMFIAIRVYHRTTGVTDLVRSCLEAEFKDPDTVATTYETRLLNGHVMTQKPYPAYALSKFNGRTWQLHSMMLAIDDSPEHNAALLIAGKRSATQAVGFGA